MRRVKVGVVGLGGIGRQHVKELVGSERAELSAVCELDQAQAEAAAGGNAASVWTDYEEMLNRCELDAVVVATPHHLHGPMGLAALQAGRHTFIEKPIACAVSEADRLVEAAAEASLQLAVGHNYRTFPGNRVLKSLLDGGSIGEAYRVFWQWLETRTRAYYDRDVWRCTWRHAGGGVLMNQTSHDLDLLCWMMGDPVEVSAMVGNWAQDIEVEDTAVANIRFASGALGNVQFSVCDRRLNYRQISGALGTIVYSDTRNANSHVPDELRLGRYATPMRDFILTPQDRIAGQPEILWEDIPVNPPSGQTLLGSFIDAILDGGQPITDGVSARRTLELINAIIMSGISRKVVDLPVDRHEYDQLLADLSCGQAAVRRQPRQGPSPAPLAAET